MHRQFAAKKRADGEGVAAGFATMHRYQNVNYN
jgi:hypothetical protein